MNFAYRGRNANGEVVGGTIEAASQEEAVMELRQKGIFVTSCKAVTSQSRKRQLFQQAVNRHDLAVFCRQLATMLQAGLPIISALHVLHKQVEKDLLRGSIGKILISLESGESFYRALEKETKIFPPLVIHTVEAGELAGSLDDNLERLSEHLEREHEIEEKVKSAMTYPAFVSVVAVLAVIFLLIFVLPTFETILNDMNVPLPWLTRSVLAISELFRYLWPLILLFVIGGIFGLKFLRQNPEGRYWFDRFLLKLPIFGSLIHKMGVARFCRTLGTLIKSGVPVLTALEIVRRVVGNVVLAEAIGMAETSVRDGESLATPLQASGILPPMVVEMISVGEETGALDELLTKISVFYEREVNETVSRLSSLIEPILIISLGGVVALVVISILLPMLSVFGGIS